LRCWIGDGSSVLRKKEILAAQKEGKREPRSLHSNGKLRAWLGELALLQGNFPQARKELDRAVELNPGYVWSYIYRAGLEHKQGHFDDVRKNLSIFERLRPNSPIAAGLHGVLAAAHGDLKGAMAYYKRALLQKEMGWIYALKGQTLAQSGEFIAALQELNNAVARDRAPWIRWLRADTNWRLGKFQVALKDLHRIVEELPSSHVARVRISDIYLEQAQYKKAEEFLTGAIRKYPGMRMYRAKRARVYFVQGKIKLAAADLDRAAIGAPHDEGLLEERIRMRLLLGDYAGAKKGLLKSELDDSIRYFWFGYMYCRQRKYRKSQEFFAKAQARSLGREPLRSKARLYGLVAKILEKEPAGKKVNKLELMIVGLGYKQPVQATVETVRQLNRCCEFFSNLSDPSVVDFLGLFPVPLKAIVFRRQDGEAVPAAADVMRRFKELKRGLIGVVTRGHPLFYGRLAWRLIEGCKKRKIPCMVPGSTSINDVFASLIPATLCRALGFEVLDSISLQKKLNPRVPIVVYNLPGDDSKRGKIQQRLLKTYSAKHSCYLLPGSGDHEFSPARVTMDSLLLPLLQADPACTLLIPAKHENS